MGLAAISYFSVATKQDRLRNPNWREIVKLAIYKNYLGVELGSAEKQLQLIGQGGTWTRNLQIPAT